MIKRIVAWLLVIATAGSLVACSKKPAEKPSETTTATATKKPTVTPTKESTVAPTMTLATVQTEMPSATEKTESTKEPTALPTEMPTIEATTKATEPATTKATVPVTTKATVPATTKATVPATTKVTVPATTKATVPVTTKATVPVTTKATVPATKPATKPTTVPTTAPTQAPTAAPTTVTTQPAETRKALAPLLALRGELPALKSREEMLDTLQREVYGYIPDAPTNIEYTVKEVTTEDYCNGKARRFSITAKCIVNGQEFNFPFSMAVPKNTTEKTPIFVFIGYTRGPTSKFQPTEAVIDKGYAIIYCNCNDISTETGGFDSGLGTILYPDGKRGNTDPGKVAMWAWGAHRMMDFAEAFADAYKLDMTRSAVCGHSRTGKAALLAGATDTRIQFTYSNESGCAGSAISRRKAGENIQRITSAFPYWLCRNYKNWTAREAEMPFDQHWLLACIAPRKVLVGSAAKDLNADPLSEQLACLAASPAFENGFACDVMAVAGEAFLEGDIGYHLREGSHAFTETDWLRAIEFIDYHTKK